MSSSRRNVYTVLLAGCPPRVGPVDKFVFLRWLQEYGRERHIGKAVSEISDDIKISEGKVRRSLARLLEAGLLEKTVIRSQRGRPRGAYKLAGNNTNAGDSIMGDEKSSIAADWIISSASDVHFSSAADEKGCSAKDRINRLTEANRLLLAILQTYADEFGLVEGVSFSKLSKMVGMNLDRTKAQLRKIADLGYIRSIIPGVSSKNLMGKVTTAYILNMREIYPNQGADHILTVVLDAPWEGVMRNKEAGLVYRACQGFKSKSVNLGPLASELKGFNEVEFENIAWIFEDLKRKAVAYFFQHKIEIYASNLLSQYWGQEIEYSEGSAGPVKKHIEKDFGYAKNKINNREGLQDPQACFDQFCNIILGLSVLLAKKIRYRIEESQVKEEFGYEIMRHLIVPSGMVNLDADFYTRTIVSSGPIPGYCGGRVYFLDLIDRESGNAYVSFDSEEEVWTGLKYASGVRYSPAFPW